MELVRSRFRRGVHEPCGGATVLGRGGVRLHAHLGNRVHRRAEFCDRGPDPGAAVDHSVDEDAGGARTAAGDGHVAAAGAVAVAHPLGAGSQIDQVEDLSIDERQFQHTLVLDDRREGSARGFD